LLLTGRLQAHLLKKLLSILGKLMLHFRIFPVAFILLNPCGDCLLVNSSFFLDLACFQFAPPHPGRFYPGPGRVRSLVSFFLKTAVAEPIAATYWLGPTSPSRLAARY
jgi:hypothetical protein